jgi:hypothetical protein
VHYSIAQGAHSRKEQCKWFGIVKLQALGLSSYKLWDCQALELSSFEIVKLWDCQALGLLSFGIVKLQALV